jgi:ferredoxin
VGVTARPGNRAQAGWRLRLDPIACDGHGLCAELFPEQIRLDDWGYPIIDDKLVKDDVVGHARRAVSNCPALALRLQRTRRVDP